MVGETTYFLGSLGNTMHKVGLGQDIEDVSVALHRTGDGDVRRRSEKASFLWGSGVKTETG
jgi:hypothetical protein